MISSGAIGNAISSLNTSLSSYQSSFEGVGSSWSGPSFDSLSSKVEAFLGEYQATIAAQLSAFAAAVAAYEQYLEAKRKIASLRSMASSASTNEDDNKVDYSAQIAEYQTKMDKLKVEIESNLSKASSPSFSATSMSDTEAAQEATKVVSEAISATAQKALDFALSVAGDNRHGYSQKNRWGNPDYDCSSLVISSWQAAGVNVKGAGASYTGNMRNAFLKTGKFIWIPGNPKVEDLRPGDVLLTERSHTELYLGDGKMVGARGGNNDGRNGDSSGNEISVTNLSRSWQGVLRYIGD